MAMEVALVSRAKVREVLAMLDVIESTQFPGLPRLWHDRKSRAVDYHPGSTDDGADWVYYNPWERRRKITSRVAVSRANATRLISDDFVIGWGIIVVTTTWNGRLAMSHVTTTLLFIAVNWLVFRRLDRGIGLEVRLTVSIQRLLLPC